MYIYKYIHILYIYYYIIIYTLYIHISEVFTSHES